MRNEDIVKYKICHSIEDWWQHWNLEDLELADLEDVDMNEALQEVQDDVMQALEGIGDYDT